MVKKRTAQSALVAALLLGLLNIGPASAATEPVTAGLATTPSGAGHWLVDTAGRVTTGGDAVSYGSLNGQRLNQPIIGIAATPTGDGYWLAASDGGIFTFGDARYLGSTGATRLNQPIIGIAPTPTGNGYWLAASDGGIFTFGDATYKGAGVGQVVAVAAAGTYSLATVDGRVSRFTQVQAKPSPTTAGRRNAFLWPFASNSPWNRPIGTGARYQDTGEAATRSLLSTATAAWVNAGQYSHPVYQARTTDPIATLRRPGHAPVSYRIPITAKPAPGSDAHLHVVDPGRRWLDESWATGGLAPNLTTGYHVRTDLHGAGVGQGGVRAYGGSAIGGLLRTWELRAGTIRHAVAIGITNDQLGRGPVWPATAEDGDAARAYRGTVRMGTLAAIPANVNVESLGLTPAGLALARALQDYGAYVVDRSGCFCFYAEPENESGPHVSQLRSDAGRLRSLLRVVANNGPGTVSGGGSPRAAIAPPLG